MKKNRIFQWIYIVVVFIFMLSLAALTVRLVQMRAGRNFYEKLCEMQAEPADVPDDTVPLKESPLLSDGEGERKAVPEKIPRLSGRVARLAKKYPDIVAWLQIPGTSVDYPVVRGEDNLFYLNHLPDGSRNALGSLFVDCRCGAGSAHIIIYGHNGSGGNMFGALKQYELQEFFAQHKTLMFATRDGFYRCLIFSVRRVEADGSAYLADFEDAGSLADYVREAAEQSIYPIETDTGEVQGVLTLSTCTGLRNQRLIVQAAVRSVPFR